MQVCFPNDTCRSSQERLSEPQQGQLSLRCSTENAPSVLLSFLCPSPPSSPPGSQGRGEDAELLGAEGHFQPVPLSSFRRGIWMFWESWVPSACMGVSHFGCVWLCDLMALLAMGFLRQEYWSGLPCSRGSSQPRDWTCVSYVSCIGRWVSLPPVPPGKPLYSAIKKERRLVIGSRMGGLGGYYAKWNKSDRERQILYDITYTWNLKNTVN